MKLKYYENNIKLIMSDDIEEEWKPFRFKAKPARAGKQYHFNIPAFAIKNDYIQPDKEYTIYIIEAEKIDISNITSDLLKSFLSFKASPASSGSQYRLTIPSFLIKNKYIDPKKKKKYWIFMIEE